MKKKFKYQDEQSNKFWEVETLGNQMTGTFGKEGTTGTSQTKTFPDTETCTKAAEKLIAEKTRKGYIETISVAEKTGNPEKISYQEVLERLNIPYLFDYWEVADVDSDSTYGYCTSEFESEQEYFEQRDRIYYYEGDLVINGDLQIPGEYFDLLVVNGNLTVNGRIRDSLDSSAAYYVTGDLHTNFLQFSLFQKTCGTETVKYITMAWAEDDEVLSTMPDRKVSSPYFFSWFYDLNCFEFAPATLITALYNYDDLTAYQTNNPILLWHEYAYAFRPEFCYTVSDNGHDTLNLNLTTIYESLKNNQSVLIDGVTPAGIRRTSEAGALIKENDIKGAFGLCKEAISLSPAYYNAYLQAGKCLWQQKAFSQSMKYFAGGIPYTPPSLSYETTCMEEAALCAVRIGEYDKALSWADMALQKNEKNDFAMRIKGEVYLLKGRLDDAASILDHSLQYARNFSTNWLRGLVYHLQGNTTSANEYYVVASSKSNRAQPYSAYQNLDYFYGEPVTVDWENTTIGAAVKDQAYWNTFFDKAMQQYGPDMYQRTGKFPDTWISEKVGTIPEAYRSKEMLHTLLAHQTKEEYDVNGNIILLFNTALLDEAMILSAIQRESPCHYDHIPSALLTDEVFRLHPAGIDLSKLPEEKKSYELCFRAVANNQYNYQHVPASFKDDKMNIALIAGGSLQSFSQTPLPSRYHAAEYIKQAVDTSINVLTRIPARFVDKEVYAHAESRYGKEPGWPFITEQYDRNRWRYGSPSDVERLGKIVQKHGIKIFENYNAQYINQSSFEYFSKHLATHPQFAQKVQEYGWDKRSKIKDEDIAEYDYDVFQKVWACYWDEQFIINALTKGRRGENERIYDLPQQYLTQKICDTAVAGNSYDFQFIPEQYITPAMCELACSLDYGAALEFVPLALRTEKVCDIALSRDADNFKFVPLSMRTINRCVNILPANTDLLKFVPCNLYTAVFNTLSKNFAKRFSPDFLLINWGLGLITDQQYPEARVKMENMKELKHQALYYTGWSYFLEGDTTKANDYFLQSQAVAKSDKVEGADLLSLPYNLFQLPKVPEVYRFNQQAFDAQMNEVTLLINARNYQPALDILSGAEQLLSDSQCSEMQYWAFVWDHLRYAQYEAGHQTASLDTCRQTIDKLASITLWDYLAEHNPIRAALRNAHNNLAYHYYQTDNPVAGLQHIKHTMKTIAPIEEKTVLLPFYETHLLLLHKAAQQDTKYEKDFQKLVDKVNKMKLEEKGYLSEEGKKVM